MRRVPAGLGVLPALTGCSGLQEAAQDEGQDGRKASVKGGVTSVGLAFDGKDRVGAC
ncbi:hypothetical protein SAMN05444920_114149 [Nonomuraea solani]|uniref:Uncharacterized protein n=1 Tax=Nonomuraea solani TaxID=1144553 RepID=A0A1H6ER31_9ACTN|nr:hypothetical protein [Nonomuraea solani]SEG99873.1 hypothetical protein SAMN05444920_114149 [Nonomuraea solani]